MITALKSRSIVDGTGSPPIDQGVVIVEDGRIKAVGPPKSIDLSSAAQIIDCSDQVLLPGLISSHIHLATFTRSPKQTEQTFFSLQQAPQALRVLRSYMGLIRDMESGITTVRALGDVDGIDGVIRDAIRDEEILGPDILACIRTIRPSHGTAGSIAFNSDGVEGVRRAVRENIARGADVIKVFATNISQGEDEVSYRFGDLTEVAAYTKEELAVAVEEAHRVGIKVAAHALGGPGLRMAIEAGVDSIEHGNLMHEEDIELFLKHGTFLSDPNLYLFFDPEYGFEARPSWTKLPQWWHDKVTRARERTRQVQSKALQAGVKFTLAMDSGHGLLWREARAMVRELGASEMEAILAVTRNSAELCGLLDEIGTLEKGKRANIISVTGDPLKQIDDLQNIKLVMKDGRICSELAFLHANDF